MQEMKKRYGKILLAVTAALFVVIVVQIVGSGTDILRRIDRSIIAMLFHFREPAIGENNPYVSPQVRLLGYDANALAVIGRWPWPRYIHAEFTDKLERFSPEAILFDTVFSAPQSVPQYVSEKFAGNPELEKRIRETFARMDHEFAGVLAKYDNIYLVLQLIENPITGLPQGVQDRIAVNEKKLREAFLHVHGQESPMVFSSLQPVLNNYIENAHPAVTNVLRDEDGVIRFFPLYFTYHGMKPSAYNVFSVVLSLLQRYYRIEKDEIEIQANKIVLHDAKDPIKDDETGQPRIFLGAMEELVGSIGNPVSPEAYPYNRNLYNFMVNEILLGDPSENRIPRFPLQLLVESDGSMRILGNWEVYDAARFLQAESIRFVAYKEKDILIDVPLGSFFYINYAGREERYFKDPNTGGRLSYFSISTGSYSDVYLLADTPDIPELDRAGRIREGYDREALEQWFLASHTGGINKKILSAFQPVFRDRLLTQTLISYYKDQFEQYLNKFIFVGANKPGLGDTHQTPYGVMCGVNVIINAFNTIITDNMLRMSADMHGLDILVLLFLCLGSSLAYAYTSARTYSYLFICIILGVLVSGIFLFQYFNFYLAMARLLLAGLFLFLIHLFFRLFTEERDKRFLRRTFENYLSPVVIRQMYEERKMPKLGGETKSVTAFFADMQGFTSLSEELTAEQIVELLNVYFNVMTKILLEGKGTLDKYEGDAIVACFGAPLDIPDHSIKALQVALSMQEALTGLCERWRMEKKSPDEPERNLKNVPPEQWAPGAKWPCSVHQLKMRIGIHTGPMVVGNIGSDVRMDYTMIGDAVNIAARLEQVCKHYGVSTLVSASTIDHPYRLETGSTESAKDKIEVRKVDTITVYGKKEPVEVFELCAGKGGLSDRDRRLLNVFNQGMTHYLNQEWDRAIEKFKESALLETGADEGPTPSSVFVERSRAYKVHPPVSSSEKWHGIHTFKEK